MAFLDRSRYPQEATLIQAAGFQEFGKYLFLRIKRVSTASAPCLAPQPITGKRKRRTVLWLYSEDYEYLSKVAAGDGDSKNVSMHRLVKVLRAAGVESFVKLDLLLDR